MKLSYLVILSVVFLVGCGGGQWSAPENVIEVEKVDRFRFFESDLEIWAEVKVDSINPPLLVNNAGAEVLLRPTALEGSYTFEGGRIFTVTVNESSLTVESPPGEKWLQRYIYMYPMPLLP